jgi:hypothetical protein
MTERPLAALRHNQPAIGFVSVPGAAGMSVDDRAFAVGSLMAMPLRGLPSTFASVTLRHPRKALILRCGESQRRRVVCRASAPRMTDDRCGSIVSFVAVVGLHAFGAGASQARAEKL